MKTHAWRFASLLLLTSAAATPALQEGIHSQADQANGGPAWHELMASMEKMHAAMASVEPSETSDTDFVRIMLPHHQAAIDMAKTQLLYGKDPQMRRLAQEIITDQQSEMELMHLWLKEHGSVLQKVDQTPTADASKEH